MKTIICYSLGNIAPKERIKFLRELYGYEDKSNHGRYNYKRKGILSKIDHDKPLNSVLIIEGNTKKVVEQLKRYNAKFIKHKLA